MKKYFFLNNILKMKCILNIKCRNENNIKKYTIEAMNNKCEGIVIKEMNSLYYCEKRSSISINL